MTITNNIKNIVKEVQMNVLAQADNLVLLFFADLFSCEACR
jgi:hypothetical protein